MCETHIASLHHGNIIVVGMRVFSTGRRSILPEFAHEEKHNLHTFKMSGDRQLHL